MDVIMIFNKRSPNIYFGDSDIFSQDIIFFRQWYIRLQYDYIIRDDFNICFCLYMVQDTYRYFAVECDGMRFVRPQYIKEEKQSWWGFKQNLIMKN